MTLDSSIDFPLSASQMPKRWYNFLPDLPRPLPPARFEGGIGSEEIMRRIRPAELLLQNDPQGEWVDIPGPVIDRLIQIGRPTPLRRAIRLERHLQTKARIYLKREDVLLTGSFKLTTAVAQAYYCRQEGRRRVVSETGAGQWGVSLALASQMFGLECSIFMARCSLEQKPYRQIYMRLLDAEVAPSPSAATAIGRKLLAENPDHPGSIGSAISDAIETALERDGAAYLSGSNINHVHLHQTLLGLETKAQLALAGEGLPDQLIACVSGGSNLCGLMMPFLKDYRAGAPIRFLGAESTAAPRLTKGEYEYCRSDLAGYTPEVLSYSMGRGFIPQPVHIGGLRQHNSSPLVSLLRREGLLEAEAYDETEAFKAGHLLLRTEGLLIAPESAHAVAAALRSVEMAREQGAEPVIVILVSGYGGLDLEGHKATLLREAAP